MSLTKPIDDITEADLQSLVDEKETESRSLDYKAVLNLDADKAKEDLRRDVSAFANSAGGDIVIGIRDEKGAPKGLDGFDLGNQSQEQYRLRLLEILQSRIKPRIQGVSIRPFQLGNGRWAAIIRVPRSFAKPHQVEIANKDFQFWFRHDGGNQRMDVDELRDAVLAADTLAERRRTFRIERVGNVVAGEMPVPMANGPKTVLHIIPLSAFSSAINYDLSTLEGEDSAHLMPLVPNFSYLRHNFDGYVTGSFAPNPDKPNSYLQVFRNGIIEAVDGRMINSSSQTNTLPATYIADRLIKAVARFFGLQRYIGVQPPALVMVTLVGVAGLDIVRNPNGFISEPTPIDRDVLMIPEILVENYPNKVDVVLRPIFDAIWNAAGYAACPNYDDNGNWQLENYSRSTIVS